MRQRHRESRPTGSNPQVSSLYNRLESTDTADPVGPTGPRSSHRARCPGGVRVLPALHRQPADQWNAGPMSSGQADDSWVLTDVQAIALSYGATRDAQ